MKKLIVRVPKKTTKRNDDNNALKVDLAAIKIIDEWHIATGYPRKWLASEMIKFASEHIEIEEE